MTVERTVNPLIALWSAPRCRSTAVIPRHPAEAIASRLAEIHDRLVEVGGSPVVIDSDDRTAA